MTSIILSRTVVSWWVMKMMSVVDSTPFCDIMLESVLDTTEAFHVTMQEYGTIRRPRGWADDAIRKKTERLARQLMDSGTLNACRVVKNNKGPQHNVNFHKADAPGPAIVRELDSLLLDAYGLPRDPLMEQMRIVRKGSAHILQPGSSS